MYPCPKAHTKFISTALKIRKMSYLDEAIECTYKILKHWWIFFPKTPRQGVRYVYLVNLNEVTRKTIFSKPKKLSKPDHNLEAIIS